MFTRLLRAAYPRVQTNKIEFLPRKREHQRVTSGNKWRSGDVRDRKAIIDLVRDIATEAAVPNSFVVFHFIYMIHHCRKSIFWFKFNVILYSIF